MFHRIEHVASFLDDISLYYFDEQRDVNDYFDDESASQSK